MSKPSNYYSMSWDEQRAWDKAERERQDLEYEREEAQRTAERAQRRARDAERAKESYRYEAESARSEAFAEADAHEQTKAELALAMEFLKSKGLAEEYDDWASYRRTE